MIVTMCYWVLLLLKCKENGSRNWLEVGSQLRSMKKGSEEVISGWREMESSLQLLVDWMASAMEMMPWDVLLEDGRRSSLEEWIASVGGEDADGVGALSCLPIEWCTLSCVSKEMLLTWFLGQSEAVHAGQKTVKKTLKMLC